MGPARRQQSFARADGSHYTLTLADLDDGTFVPAVLMPLVLRQDGHSVVYGTGSWTQTYTPPAPDEASSPVQEWTPPDQTPVGAMRQLTISGSMNVDGEPVECRCGAQQWVLEWVAGAVAATATLECRACWRRYPSDLARGMARTLTYQRFDPTEDIDIRLP